jgi:hypothetical protein
MNKLLYVFIALVIVLSSCLQDNSIIIAEHDSYIVDNIKINLPVPQNKARHTASFFDTRSKKDYLIFYKPDTTSKIIFFDLAKHDSFLSAEVKLKSNKHSSFYLGDIDTLYLVNEPNTIYKYCISSDTIINKIIVKDVTRTYGKDYMISSSYFYVMYRYNNNYQICFYPTWNVGGKNRKKYMSSNLFISVNDSGEIVNEYGAFPSKYLVNNYNATSAHITANCNEKFCYSFATEDTISIYDLNSMTTDNKAMSSKFYQPHDTCPCVFPKDDYYGCLEKYSLENFSYFNLIYDQFRKKYYRICLHKYKYENADGTVNTSMERPWSIIVADSNFNIEKEVTFPALKYDYRFVYVTSKGLIVSKNNEYNPNYKPKMLIYDVFKF